MEERTCARCGAPFTTRHPTKKFCSADCQVSANRAATKQSYEWSRAPRICAGCEEVFVPALPHQKWCGKQCRDRERQRRYRNLNAPESITRPCRYCGESFSSPDGRQYYCSDACSLTAKSLREAFRRYGITMEEYRTRWVQQAGVCAICSKPERTERNRLLTIDHDHVTQRIRGLLCSQCNRGIGLFGDDPVTLRAAADYIEQYRAAA